MRNDEIKRLEREAYCPFFKGIGKTKIKCEGPYKGTVIHMTMDRNSKLMKHFKKYCSTKECEECRIYKTDMDKYEES